MPELVQRSTIDAPGSWFASGARAVLLATLSVRIDPQAERIAIDSALDSGAPLIVANMLWLPPYPATLMLAPEYVTLPHEEDREAVRATADRAAARGLRVELLRVWSRRPVAALIELIRDRDAALVVLGPDLSRTSRLALRLASRRLRRSSDCLVWIVPDG